MLTKATIKFIKSLQLKKNRQEHQRFLVEGAKSVSELLASDFEVELIAGTQEFRDLCSTDLERSQLDFISSNEREISAMSSFKNNNSVIAIAKMKSNLFEAIPNDRYVIALDEVRDPGNLGTIIRIADWYGIDTIVASKTTTEYYNPKVISATMGSFTRVAVHYVDLKEELKKYEGKIYGAMMGGVSVHQLQFASHGILVMGNESNGIGNEITTLLTDQITIPRFGKAESLNVAIATAVICDRIRT